jgi:hypothetical protein
MNYENSKIKRLRGFYTMFDLFYKLYTEMACQTRKGYKYSGAQFPLINVIFLQGFCLNKSGYPKSRNYIQLLRLNYLLAAPKVGEE